MEKLMADVRTIFADRQRLDEDDTQLIHKVLENYKSNPADWQRYARFHPLKYTRNLIDMVDGKYNLIVICWGPGQFSGIHDHTDSHCFVKILQGNLLETRYAWPETEDQPLVEIGSDLYQTNAVTYISDKIGLHRMENESHTDGTVTLHLYTPPLENCQIFDLRTGRRAFNRSTYYTRYGEKIDGDAVASAPPLPSTSGIIIAAEKPPLAKKISVPRAPKKG